MANSSEASECPAGRYGSETGLADPSCSGLCTQGYFCEAGSDKPTPCPEGTYGTDKRELYELSCRPFMLAGRDEACALHRRHAHAKQSQQHVRALLIWLIPGQ